MNAFFTDDSDMVDIMFGRTPAEKHTAAKKFAAYCLYISAFIQYAEPNQIGYCQDLLSPFISKEKATEIVALIEPKFLHDEAHSGERFMIQYYGSVSAYHAAYASYKEKHASWSYIEEAIMPF
jgi:hypothetical protein